MSNSNNIVIAVVVAVGGFLAYRVMNSASGPGEALGSVGQTVGGFLDFGGEVAGGIAERVGEGFDWSVGGLADAAEVPGQLGEDAYNIAGDGYDGLTDAVGFLGGGTADVISSADDTLGSFTPQVEEPDWDGDGSSGGDLVGRFL